MSNFIERKKINPNLNMKTFPLLALEQWERLILAHNVEFRGGFYMQVSGSNNDTKEIYVPDTREVFCNTCQALAILIKPKFKEPMKKIYDSVHKKLKELQADFLNSSSVKENVVLGESFYTKEEDKILLEEYNNRRVKIYQELFEGLSTEFQAHRYWIKASTDD